MRFFLFFLAALSLQLCQTTTYLKDNSNTPLFEHNVSFPGNQNSDNEFVILEADVKTSVRHNLVASELDPSEEFIRYRVSEELQSAINKGEESLEVQFKCQKGCSFEDSYIPRQILVLPKKGEVETPEIEFSFTPQKVSKVETAIFSILIYRSGLVYDNFILEACIYPSGFNIDEVKQECIGKLSPQPVEKVVQLKSEAYYIERSKAGERADVHFRLEKTPQAYKIVAEINDTKLASKLAKAQFSKIKKIEDRDVWEIPTILATEDDLRTLSHYIYQKLSCLVVKKKQSSTQEYIDFIEYLSEDIPNCAVSPDANSESHWGKKRTQHFGEQYLEIGNQLRTDLFPGEEGKILLTQILDRANNKLRRKNYLSVSYDFGAIRLPIQFLHQMEEFNYEQPNFLGMVATIADYSGAIQSEQGSTVLVDTPSANHVAFIGYRNEISSDFIEEKSKSQINRTRRVLKNKNRKLSQTLFKPDNIVSYLKQNRNEIDLIWIYAHGDSRGWSNQNPYGLRDGSQRILTTKKSNSKYEALTSGRFRELKDSGVDQPLRKKPLIVMLACETNSPTIGATNNRSFSASLRNIGAGGILSSEAEIPASTAEEFGDQLAISISSQSTNTPPIALLEIRRNMYFGANKKVSKGSMLDLGTMLIAYTGGHGELWAIV